jgi:hypothetical protein
VSANFDIGDGMTLTPHVGHQTVKHTGGFLHRLLADVAKDFSGLVVSGAVVGTDADKGSTPARQRQVHGQDHAGGRPEEDLLRSAT